MAEQNYVIINYIQCVMEFGRIYVSELVYSTKTCE